MTDLDRRDTCSLGFEQKPIPDRLREFFEEARAIEKAAPGDETLSDEDIMKVHQIGAEIAERTGVPVIRMFTGVIGTNYKDLPADDDRSAIGLFRSSPAN